MGARAAAAARTREAILDAAEDAFEDQWFDDVTLADVARLAGVSQQTIVNHFGSKEDLYITGIGERVGPRISARRDRARKGEVRSVVETAVDDYEQTGIGLLRVLATADRYPTMTTVAESGRVAHREWVTRCFPAVRDDRNGVIDQLCVLLDVRTWSQFRHEHGFDEARTVDTLVRMVEDALSHGNTGTPR
nr:TetR/AcrR family transcriptional regulator [Gordonia sp. SID5947]